MSSSDKEKERLGRLISVWEKHPKHLIEALGATMALVETFAYERKKRFITWWIDYVIQHPLPAAIVDEMLSLARKSWKGSERNELIGILRSARTETFEFAMRLENTEIAALHRDMEGRFLKHLCEMLREDDQHQA